MPASNIYDPPDEEQIARHVVEFTTGLREGQEVTYYPRQGKPGHPVTIVSLTPHLFHSALVRFRYADGRERELTIGRFYRTPE